MSLSDLKQGGLYVLLFIRSHPPKKDDFHWGLYLHKNGSEGGTKFHIKGLGTGWITDHGRTLGVWKSIFLIGLFRIADIAEGQEHYTEQTIRTYDGQINQMPGITCRKWLLWVLELLQRSSNGYVALKCDDLVALESEITDFGNAKAGGASRNEQPRALGASRICGLAD